MIALFAQLPPALQALLDASLVASVLALVICAAQVAFRRALPARFRFALWLLLFVRLSLIPLPASGVSLFNLLHHLHRSGPAIAAKSPAAPTIAPSPTHESPSPAEAAPPPPISFSSPTAPPSSSSPNATPVLFQPSSAAAAPASPIRPHIALSAIVTTAYLGVAGLFLLRLVLASLALRRVVRQAEPATDRQLLNSLDYARLTLHVRRRATLLLTDAIDTPAITGIFHPCLLLPRRLAETLAPHELHFVFLHEYAHLRRGDVLLNCWWAILHAVHWFNPLLWLLAPRIRADRELACDELVLHHTTDASAYGHTLLKILELLGSVRRSPAAVGIIESRSSFTGRIQMIAKYRKHPLWITAAAASGVLALACIGLTDPQIAAAAPTASPAPSTPAAPATPQDLTAQDAPALPPMPAVDPPATAIQISPQTGGTWHMDVNGQPISPEKVIQLRKQIEDLNTQLGAMRTTSSNGAKDVAGIVTTLLQAQKDLAGQMMDMEKQLALAAIQSPAALDGNGKAQVQFTGANGGGALAGSQDPVMDNLLMTRNSLQQDIAGVMAAGGENDSQKRNELSGRLSEIEHQIADLKAERADQAKAADAMAASARSRSSASVANPMWSSKAFQLKNGRADEIVRVLEQTFSGAGASITSDLHSNSVVVRGPEKTVDSIEGVVKSLDVPVADKARAVPQAQTSFSVRDLIGAPEGLTAALTADQRAAENELEVTLKQMTGPDAQISTFNGSIIFRGSQKDRDTIATLLDDLRAKQQNQRH